MNNNLTKAQLERLDVPRVAMRTHQMHLKRVLLAAYPPRQTLNIWEGWKNLMSIKKIALTGVALSVAVFGAVTFSILRPNSSSIAHALADQSTSAVAKLTPGERESLKTNLHYDAQSELQAARQASDLVKLTYSQVAANYPSMDNAPAVPGKKPTDLRQLTYLQFTGSDGATHLLGLDADNLPVFATVSFKVTPDPNAQKEQGTSTSPTVSGGASEQSASSH